MVLTSPVRVCWNIDVPNAEVARMMQVEAAAMRLKALELHEQLRPKAGETLVDWLGGCYFPLGDVKNTQTDPDSCFYAEDYGLGLICPSSGIVNEIWSESVTSTLSVSVIAT